VDAIMKRRAPCGGIRDWFHTCSQGQDVMGEPAEPTTRKG
jgi:hypothetical protein